VAVYTNFNQVVNRIQQVIDGRTTQAYIVAEAAGGTGARMTEDLTRTRPSLKSGKRGRVESGDMADGVSYDVKRNDKSMIRVDFGWLDNPEPYMVYQTATGFTHYLSGEYIAPTDALRDATEHVREMIADWVKGGGK